MPESTESLRTIIAETRRLIMGPDPRPHAHVVDLGKSLVALPKQGPYVDLEGNEILRTERPTNVYGVGVLFPDTSKSVQQDATDEASDQDEPPGEEIDLEPEGQVEELLEKLLRNSDDDPDESATPALVTRLYRPRSIGISFLCAPNGAELLEVLVTGGRYEFHSLPPAKVQLPDGEAAQKTLRLYRYQPVQIIARVPIKDFPNTGSVAINVSLDAPGPLGLKMEAFVRAREDKQFLLTCSLINTAQGMNNDENCFFQAGFVCAFLTKTGEQLPAILPYPEGNHAQPSDEDATMNLLYHEMPGFATGHGCATNWQTGKVPDRAYEVAAEPLPVHWAETITADLVDHAPTMLGLSSDEWQLPLQRLVDEYATHIAKLDPFAVAERHRTAAHRHVDQANDVVRRMNAGLDILKQDQSAQRAFRLANNAMRLQQIASRLPARRFLSFAPDTTEPRFSSKWISTLKVEPDKEPAWRAFQIAFLLMNIGSICDDRCKDRQVVDLIWFPTGGGKTEAYLGLIAFACLYQRLQNPGQKRHVQVLMRYTMRLLTAQQFQRAASLACALEAIRIGAPEDLGEPLALGIWVGNAVTPNTRAQARKCITDMEAGHTPFQSLFLHTQCPWCGAEVGTVKELPRRKGDRNRQRRVLGWSSRDDSFRCSDRECHFHLNSFPFHVVDEILLDELPTLLIATVDKFALLPKKPELRRFFGLGPDGNRVAPAPSLIVQDELHLISEALGSMVGAYEPLIHALCARGATSPKVICSTATIRTYTAQIKSLFARESVCIFPPPEFAIGRSFFARFELDDTGIPKRSKAFLGVFGTGYLSYQTAEAITLASLLQAPMALPDSDASRDPFWTLVCFFSTLRELGTTLTLMHSAVRNRIRNIAYWRGLDKWTEERGLHRVEELTSRASSNDLTRIMSDLALTRSSGKAIDSCLATSIVEVGIDISRLSLLAVVGQPKKTSTYVQVTGRVGRRHPALVVTLYDHTRARDRSVYESFKTFHERMYAGVEPTSLTPFAMPVQDRALTAIIAGFTRLASREAGLAKNPSYVPPQTLTNLADALPGPLPDEPEAISSFIRWLEDWVRTADGDEADRLIANLDRRLREWAAWQKQQWHCWSFHFRPSVDNPMMLDIDPMSAEVSTGSSRWYIPNSMRDVDSESQLWIHPGAGQSMIPGSNDELFPETAVEG